MSLLSPVIWLWLLTTFDSSLALISARATIQSLEVLSLLTASYLYTLCQALDLRALQTELQAGIDSITRSQLSEYFDAYLSSDQLDQLFTLVSRAMDRTLETSSTMDAAPRMKKVAGAAITPIVEFASEHPELAPALTKVVEFRTRVAGECFALLEGLRKAYLNGDRGDAPAARFLGRTRPVYEFVRVTLGVKMHGKENAEKFGKGLGVEDGSIGQNISLIYEVRFFPSHVHPLLCILTQFSLQAIRDGKMQDVIVGIFDSRVTVGSSVSNGSRSISHLFYCSYE